MSGRPHDARDQALVRLILGGGPLAVLLLIATLAYPSSAKCRCWLNRSGAATVVRSHRAASPARAAKRAATLAASTSGRSCRSPLFTPKETDDGYSRQGFRFHIDPRHAAR